MAQGSTILIADSNPGFATMLKESLEGEAGCQATIAPTAAQALELATQHPFDLAIVDLGMESADGLDGEAVARRLRDTQRDLRLMIIPIEGDELPDELSDLNVQGTLSKPFFLPDLPDLVGAALAAPIDLAPVAGHPQMAGESEAFVEPASPVGADVSPGPTVGAAPEEIEQPIMLQAPGDPEPPRSPSVTGEPELGSDSERSEQLTPPESPEMFEIPHAAEVRPDVDTGRSQAVDLWPAEAASELETLGRELNATIALVSQQGEVVAGVGQMTGERRDALAQSIWQACQLSSKATRTLGREASAFEQSIEGEGFLLCTLAIIPDVLLSVAVRPDAALGYVRHQVRTTAGRLREILPAS